MKMEILKSKVYSKFLHDERNREVGNITPLVQSMQKYGFVPFCPIIVEKRNGFFVIRDGQHRFEAARRLGLEIYYLVVPAGSSDVSIAELNRLVSKWKPESFIGVYARAGNPEYMALVSFSENNSLPLNVSASLMQGHQALCGNAHRSVKDGSFTIQNMEYAELVADILNVLREYDVKTVEKRLFIQAISRCCLVSKFDVKWFLKNAVRQAYKFKAVATLDDYLDMIQEIYNDRAGSRRIDLKFLANEISAKRRVAMGRGSK